MQPANRDALTVELKIRISASMRHQLEQELQRRLAGTSLSDIVREAIHAELSRLEAQDAARAFSKRAQS